MASQFTTIKFSRQGLADPDWNPGQSVAFDGHEGQRRRWAKSAVHLATTGPAVFATGSNQPEIKLNEITALKRHSMR